MLAKTARREDRAVQHLKGRIAEALVEGMLMRAGYAVSRMGRESQDEFLPDFIVRRPVERPGSDRPLHALVHVEVKYRHDIARFWRRDAVSFFESAKRWPDLWLVLVTDRPEQGRSCFQVLRGADDIATTTTDLECVPLFDIDPSTAAEYADLTTKLFALLAESRAGRRTTRVG